MASKKQDLSQILTPKDVAAMLKCSVDVINDLFRSGKIKGFKVARQWRTKLGDYYDYINNSSNKYK